MGYYQGDYYRGDYYRGDVFGFIKKAIGGVAKIAGSVLPGPVGAAAKAVGNALAPRAPQAIAVPMNAGNFPVSVHGAGQATQLGAYQMANVSVNQPGNYDMSPVPTWAPGMRRPGRRMNVTNVKALRRAGRRVRGFLKLAGKLGALPVSRSAKGKLFKRRVRR